MAQRGSYNTLKKESVLDYLIATNGRHVTADELVEALSETGMKIGRTTAYRHLERLTEMGIVTRFQTESGGCACYQYTGGRTEETPSQLHCVCTRCGSLTHVSCDLLREMRSHFEKEHAFLLDPARTVLYGLCQNCRKEDEYGASDAEPCDHGI